MVGNAVEGGGGGGGDYYEDCGSFISLLAMLLVPKLPLSFSLLFMADANTSDVEFGLLGYRCHLKIFGKNKNGNLLTSICFYIYAA